MTHSLLGDPAQLRQRANGLRALAARLSSCLAIGLDRRAGDDVWRGPTATRCATELVEIGRELVAASDDLRDRARALDQAADALEVRRLAGAGG